MKAIGELLALEDDRKQASTPGVHKGGLSQEPGVNTVQEQLRLNGQAHDGSLLGRNGLLAAQIPNQLLPPRQERPGRC